MSAAGCATPRRGPPDAALAYSGAAVEGFPPEVVVQRVLADSGILAYYDDILNGRQPWPSVADTATLIYYLARSEQGRFLGTFLRYATEPANAHQRDTWSMATTGLIALADSATARNRLMQMTGANESRGIRLNLAMMLVTRNTVAARAILAHVDTSDFPPAELKRLHAAMAMPPKP